MTVGVGLGASHARRAGQKHCPSAADAQNRWNRHWRSRGRIWRGTRTFYAVCASVQHGAWSHSGTLFPSVYVCMCMCLHACICVCIYVYMWVFACMYVSMCMCVCVSVCMCVHECIHVCMWVYACVYVCMHVCTCVYVCMHKLFRMLGFLLFDGSIQALVPWDSMAKLATLMQHCSGEWCVFRPYEFIRTIQLLLPLLPSPLTPQTRNWRLVGPYPRSFPPM